MLKQEHKGSYNKQKYKNYHLDFITKYQQQRYIQNKKQINNLKGKTPFELLNDTQAKGLSKKDVPSRNTRQKKYNQGFQSWTDKKVNQIKKKYNVKRQNNNQQAKESYKIQNQSSHNQIAQRPQLTLNRQTVLTTNQHLNDNLPLNYLSRNQKLRQVSDNLPLEQISYLDISNPRIQNIDKINAKIKLILNSRDNQYYEPNTIRKTKSIPKTRIPLESIIKNSVISLASHNFNSEFDISQKDPILCQRNPIGKLQRNKNLQSRTNHLIMANQQKTTKYQSSQRQNYRYKSQNNFYAKKSHDQKEINVKQIQKKIQMIGKKIISLQNEKKKLNIKFQPFNYKIDKVRRLKTQLSPHKYCRSSSDMNKQEQHQIKFKGKNIKQLKSLKQYHYSNKRLDSLQQQKIRLVSAKQNRNQFF